MAYIDLLHAVKADVRVNIWAYCLMPNHVHMIGVPDEAHSLSKLFGTVHHRYAKRVNAIHDWRGHLWQERFFSVVMDEKHTLAALRYVELNPVRAGLCRHPEEWPWSSVHGHLGLRTDSLLDDSAIRDLIVDWRAYLAQDEDADFTHSLRAQTGCGRPQGDERFLDALESKTGRRIRRNNPGPAPRG
jgi:putative transposase